MMIPGTDIQSHFYLWIKLVMG